MERSGKAAWVDDDWYAPDNALSDRPEFIAYRRWIETKGIRTYLTFLLAHPWYLLRSIVYNPTLSDEHYRGICRMFNSRSQTCFPVLTGGYQTFFTPYPKWLRNFLLAPFGWFIPLLYLVVVVIRYTLANYDPATSIQPGPRCHRGGGRRFRQLPRRCLGYLAALRAIHPPDLHRADYKNCRGRERPSPADTTLCECPHRTYWFGHYRLQGPRRYPEYVSTSLSTGARLNTVWVVAVSIVCASVAWASHNYYFSAVQASWQVASSTSGNSVAGKATDISELRPVPEF